jgi:hypothetical protein
MEAENTAVLQMQRELATAQAQHAQVVQRLEARLQWHAENQELAAGAGSSLQEKQVSFAGRREELAG